MKTVPSLKSGLFLWALLFQLYVQSAAFSQIVLNYQGRVISGGTAFNGTGQFKFAIVSADGSTFHWKNDGTTTAEAPATAVSLPVNKGLFSVQLGDAVIVNMGTINSTVLSNAGVKLRVWFNDGFRGFQKFEPDIGIVGYGAGSQLGNIGPGFERQFYIDYLYARLGGAPTTALAAGGARFIESNFTKIQKIKYKIVARTGSNGALAGSSARTVTISYIDQLDPNKAVSKVLFSKTFSPGRSLQARWDPSAGKIIEDEVAAFVEENISIPYEAGKSYILEVTGSDSGVVGTSGISIGTIVLDVF
jgi:hypothetical protein